MKLKNLIILISIGITFSCQEFLLNESDNEISYNWIYDTEHWTEENDKISYSGKNSADSVAWVDNIIKDNVSIEFIWNAQSDNSHSELFIYLYGSGALNGDILTKGINITYTSGDDNNTSMVRVNGIYDGTNFISFEDNLPFIEPNQDYNCKIEFENKVLTLTIDEHIIQNRLFVDFSDTEGYFGVANYWENTKQFSLSEVQFN